jgi:hypothetical protein
MNKEKRMVAGTGYEVRHSIHIGDKEILVASNMNAADGNYYLVADYKNCGLIAEYSRCAASADYLEIMSEFTARVNAQIEAVRAEIAEADYQAEPIAAADCFPHDYGQDLRGKVVAIKADVLRAEYRRADRQIVLIDGGFGASGNSLGSAVFCYYLHNGKHTRFERRDVLGEIRELPDWAKERLAMIKAERETERTLPQAAAPEVVAGYAILERVRVNDKTFVLGHNPNNAATPYVTWQSMDGRGGYDLGHYFAGRGKALRDLRSRADKERSGGAPDRAKRSRDDLR